jgi:hypothetical protein
MDQVVLINIMNLYSNSNIKLVFSMRLVIILLILLIFINTSNAQQTSQPGIILKTISIEETAGQNRQFEPVEILFNLKNHKSVNPEKQISVVEILDDANEKEIPCQIFDTEKKLNDQVLKFKVIFQVNIVANGKKTYRIIHNNPMPNKFEYSPDLKVIGKGFGLIVENEYYRADLTPGEGPKKESDSGQIREVTILGDSKKKLMRYDRRIHWSPNFIRTDNKINQSIAHWDHPENYTVEKGPIVCMTKRWGTLKNFPEIFISAIYKFYAHLPYFVFSSRLEMKKDIYLDRLRNDEMTTDTIFTHFTFKRPSGEIFTLPFKNRQEILNKNPIEADAPWLFFYEPKQGFALGCIRLIYNNTNIRGIPSPTTGDYTKISDGAQGGKYWNRILILNKPVLISEGSVYKEKNAYIVFNNLSHTNLIDLFEYYEKCLHNPLKVTFLE